MDIQKFIANNDFVIQALCSSTCKVRAFLPCIAENDVSFATDKYCGTLKAFAAPTANQIHRQCINYMEQPVAFLLAGKELIELTATGAVWHGKLQRLTIAQAEDSRVCFKAKGEDDYYGVI